MFFFFLGACLCVSPSWSLTPFTWAVLSHWKGSCRQKSSLDSFSSSPTTAAVDSSAQESPPRVHTLFNQPTALQNPLWVRSCKTSRSKGLNICSGNRWDLVKMQPSSWPEGAGCNREEKPSPIIVMANLLKILVKYDHWLEQHASITTPSEKWTCKCTFLTSCLCGIHWYQATTNTLFLVIGVKLFR